jgi:transcriptional regulator with XRE-family HTH domain
MSKRNPFVEFGFEVRRRRQWKGMTLEELAQSADLTPNYVGTIEIGRRDPSLTTIIALAKALGVHPAELLGTVPELSPHSEEAARLFDDAPPEMQEAVLQILRACAKLKN